MDSLITAAARALAAGDPLGALKRVALRDDPAALALRGIAMAQLGELPRARDLLRQAARAFGPHETLARARCVVAEAEVALALRELGGPARPLLDAAATLESHGDVANALQAHLIATRRLLLIGRLADAAAVLARLHVGTDTADAADRCGTTAMRWPPTLRAMAELATAEIALRSLHIGTAREALGRAHAAATRAGVPALLAEVAQARAVLCQPAARRVAAGSSPQPLRLDEVAALLASGALVVDGCRHGVGAGHAADERTAGPASAHSTVAPAAWQSLARRPLLFALARALAKAWPGDADRDALIATAFRTRHADETHRARLRVEVGRLRALLKPFARIEATPRGFALRPLAGRDVVLLAPPIDGEPGALLALLSDGAAWSTSALALAVGASQRTVQRELAELQAAGQVRSIGQARAQRWLAPPLAGFTTILLLPAALPIA